MITGSVHLFGIDIRSESTKSIAQDNYCQLASFAKIGDLLNFLPDYFLDSKLLELRNDCFSATFNKSPCSSPFQPEIVVHINLSDFAFQWLDITSGNLKFTASHIRSVIGMTDLEVAISEKSKSLMDEVAIIFNVNTDNARLIQACEEIDTQMLTKNNKGM